MQLIYGVIAAISLILAFAGAGLFAYLINGQILKLDKKTLVAILIVLPIIVVLVNIFIHSLALFLEI